MQNMEELLLLNTYFTKQRQIRMREIWQTSKRAADYKWAKTGGSAAETDSEVSEGQGQQEHRFIFFSAVGRPVTCCKWGREESEWVCWGGGLDYNSAGGLSRGKVKGPWRGKGRQRGHHRRTGSVGKHEGNFEALQMFTPAGSPLKGFTEWWIPQTFQMHSDNYRPCTDIYSR